MNEPELVRRIETDYDFGYDFKRIEFFGHDFLHLHENPDYTSWQIIQRIETTPYNVELFPHDSLITWLNSELKLTYEDSATLERVLQHDFSYVSRSTMQTWLDCATGTLIELLKGKGVPCPNSTLLWEGYIQPYA